MAAAVHELPDPPPPRGARKFEDLSPQHKAAAARLLTPQQLTSLNGSALDLIPGDEMGALMNRVPGPVRQIVEAENQLRRLVTDPGASFASRTDAGRRVRMR